MAVPKGIVFRKRGELLNDSFKVPTMHLHHFIKTSSLHLSLCLYLYRLHSSKKKKKKSTLPFDLALWGAVSQWDGECGPQKESRSYQQESHTGGLQIRPASGVWSSVWRSSECQPLLPRGLKKGAAAHHGSCGLVEKDTVDHWLTWTSAWKTVDKHGDIKSAEVTQRAVIVTHLVEIICYIYS